MRRHALAFPLAAAVALALTACSDSGSTGDTVASEPSITVASEPSTSIPASTTTGLGDAILEQSLACDPLDERACLLPWPNDAFTVPDPATATGRRLAIHAQSTPANADGVHIDVTDQNRADLWNRVKSA